MPQTIYLPEKKNWWDPVMKQGTNFLWQLAMVKARHKIKMEETDRLLALEKIEAEKERAREKAKLEESRAYEKEKTKEERAHQKKVREEKRAYPAPSADAKDYKIAQQQFILGKGPNPGSFMDYKQKMAKSRATRITFEEKLGLHTAKKKADIKMAIKSPNYERVVIDRLKALHGPNWQDLSDYEKSEMVFQATHRDVSETYPNAVFDDRRGGWFDPETGKLIKSYKGWVPEPKERIMERARKATEFRPY